LEIGDEAPTKLLDKCHICVGIPVKPMLAKAEKAINLVLNRFEN